MNSILSQLWSTPKYSTHIEIKRIAATLVAAYLPLWIDKSIEYGAGHSRLTQQRF